ncbi:glycosyltransferase [Candidatus Peregrinibacteria bacterium]|nr:glycosyltransferase [Candidatus Peregrinibacteria bacterium]
MKLLMISGDRSIFQGRMGAFWYTLQELRKHWDRIDVICPHVSESSVTMSESGHRFNAPGEKVGGEVFFHPSPYSLYFQSSWIYERGRALIAQEKHDVMTVHEYPPFYNGRGAKRLSRKTGVPYAIEVHHIVGLPHASGVTEVFGRLLSWLVLPGEARGAGGVRVVNHAVEAKLASWGIPKNKIAVLSSFYLDRELLTLQCKPPVAYDVAFCGRLVSNKGLSEVLDALALVKNARMIVIGDGPLRGAMEAKVKQLQLGNRVTFVGWLPSQEAVSGAMQSARMFVMCSKSEGGPRVALEAMACGLPVIVTRVGVMPEVIRDGVNGIFTTGKPKDLAAKISGLMGNEAKRVAMGNEASRILNQFERQTLIKSYADFLKKLAR